MPERPREAGVALVITLLVVALMTALIVEFDFRTRLDLRAAGNFRDDVRAYMLAESGVEAARAFLLEDTGRALDSLQEDWGDLNQELFDIGMRYVIGTGIYVKRGRCALSRDAPVYGIPLGSGYGGGYITDESGKLDLNLLVVNGSGKDPKALLWQDIYERLLLDLFPPDDNVEDNPDLADILLESLMDWLDGDSQANTYGAETGHYGGLTAPYNARNGPIPTVDELGLVRGYTQNVRQILVPYVTARGSVTAAANAGKINVNTAPEMLLRALHDDMTQANVEDLCADRSDDSRPIAGLSRGDVGAARLKDHYGLDEDAAAAVSKLLRVNSEHFRVWARGEIGEDPDSAVRRTIVATIHRSGAGKATITSWRVE